MSSKRRPRCRVRTLAAISAIAASWAALAGGALAQSGVPGQVAPSALAPGTIERQFQSPPQPRARPEAIQLPGAQQRAPAGAEAVRFGVQRIEITGARALPPQIVQALVAPLEGREISLADLVELANRLTATYRNEGFILAQVVVPEQRIAPHDAVVQLQAVEGFIDAVRFSGDVGSDAARLDAIASSIRSVRPITAETLERYLLLLNDIPGLRASTTLTPSPTQTSAADLEIRLSRRALSGEISIDNRGSRAVGPWRATVDIEASGLTGPSRTAAKIVSTGDRKLLFGHLQHEQTINSEGTRFVLNVGAARSKPDLQAAAPLAVESESRTLGLSIQHPLIRSRAQNLYLRLGLAGYNGETLANATRASADRVRALRLGLTWDRADSYQGLNVADVELSRGLSSLGANARFDPDNSRTQARPDFMKATLYAARLQSLARRWSILVAASAQYALSDLPAPELFGLGGEPFGRGYEPSELLGDHGAALKVELRYTAGSGLSWLPSYTLYAFYDAGLVRRRTPVDETQQASLASAGVGLRFGTDRRVSGFIEVAQPLTRPVAARGDRDTRSHAGVAAKF